MALIPDISDAVNALLPAGTAVFTGEENLSAQGAPPRVVWVPTQDAFGPATQRGSKPSDPRALLTCRAGMDIHCWAESFAAAQALRDALVLALRTAIGVNYQITGGRWLGQEWTALGRVYVLSLTIDIPITDATPALASPPISVPTTISFAPGHPGP